MGVSLAPEQRGASSLCSRRSVIAHLPLRGGDPQPGGAVSPPPQLPAAEQGTAGTGTRSPRLWPDDGSRDLATGAGDLCRTAAFSFPAWRTSLLPSPPLPRAPYNQEKNRYGDVPCLDQTRVKLAKPYSRPEVSQLGMETWDPA